MPAVLEKASTVSDKGQTTLPVDVRRALGVAGGDSVTFRVEGDGTVLVRKTEEEAEDPALAAFLGFLAADIQQRPREIRAITGSLEMRLWEIIAQTEVHADRDCISGDVGL